MTNKIMRPIRSFVLRQGRLTKGQEYALTHLWPRYGIEKTDLLFDFEEIFGRIAPITVEIGFGDGVSLTEMAKAAPEIDFLGIEVHRPGVGRLLHLIEEHELSNLRVMSHDAVEIFQQNIPIGSLNRVQLFFPDPWHKKRHNKRRIVQPDFVSLVASRLRSKGIFHLATDWEDYAEHMKVVMKESDEFKSTNLSLAPNKSNLRPETKFERRGLKLGHGVWDLVYARV